jgi:hypothetical protein
MRRHRCSENNNLIYAYYDKLKGGRGLSRLTTIILCALLITPLLAQAEFVNIGEYGTGSGAFNSDGYGTEVLYLQDINGDSIGDIAVSAPYNDSGGTDSGAVYIFFGPFPRNGTLDAIDADLVLTGRAGELFGTSISSGDIDNDGRTDLIVGAPDSRNARGAVYVFYGKEIVNASSLEANATFAGYWQGIGYGLDVECLKDINKDGFDDFAVGTRNGNLVSVFQGREDMITPALDLWELETDRPLPVDFTSGINSTANTFGLGNGDDGWDWEGNIYGGSDPNYDFIPLVNQGGSATRLEIELGGGSDGNGGSPHPAVSAGYGVEFNITQDMIDAINAGGRLVLKFSWNTRDVQGLENNQREMYWVKARFWNSTTNASYLGWNYDGDNNPANDENDDATTDATLDIFYVDWAWGSPVTYSDTETLDVTRFVDGAHEYYVDFGGKLSDWSATSEILEVNIDDISLGIEFNAETDLYGRWSDRGFGRNLEAVGDFNGDGYNDFAVADTLSSKVAIYYGSDTFGSDFSLYWGWAIPNTIDDTNDTTSESSSFDLRYDDGAWGGNTAGYYEVRQSQVMYVDTWTVDQNLRGEIVEAWLYIQYKSEWTYTGNNYVRWAKEGESLENTDCQPHDTNYNEDGNYYDGTPFPLHEHGLERLPELEEMDLEFTNNDNSGWGGRIFFDFAWIYTYTQMAANITIHGPVVSGFGSSIASPGSINVDAYNDLVIGSPNEDDTGKVYIFFGGRDLVENVTRDDADVVITGIDQGDRFGSSVAGAGHFSLDNIPDFAVSAPGRGELYVFRGTPVLESGNATLAHYRFNVQDSMNGDGDDLDTIGDIDGRGADEILYGFSQREGAVSTGPGQTFILYNSDEDILEQDLIIDFYPKLDPTINEGESVEFGVMVKAPTELNVLYSWYLDSKKQLQTGSSYTYSTDFESAGVHDVRVQVTDGIRTESRSWKVTVLEVNGPPVAEFFPVGDPIVDEGIPIRFWVKASDPDGDPITYVWKLDGNTQTGITGAEFEFTPGYDHAGLHEVVVDLTDGFYTVDHVWIVRVLDVNRPPVIDSVAPESDIAITELSTQLITVSAHDPDGDPLLYIWRLDGESVNIGTDSWEYKALQGEIGEYLLEVEVSDGDLSAFHTWKIIVSRLNLPPVIDEIRPGDDILLDLGDQLLIEVFAHDPEGVDITISWMNGSVERWVGENWTFTATQSERVFQIVTLDVSDGKHHVLHNISLTINRPPAIDDYSPEGDIYIKPGQDSKLSIQASDPDNDPLNYEWYVNGELIHTASETSMEFNAGWDVGSIYNVKVVVSDGRLDASQDWIVRIADNIGSPPVPMIKFNPENPRKGETVTFDASNSTDNDNDIVKYEWRFTDSAGIEGVSTSRIFEEQGTYSVTLTVTDAVGNSASTTEVVTIGKIRVDARSESPMWPILLLVLIVLLCLALYLGAKEKGWIATGAKRKKRAGTEEDELEMEEEPEEEMEMDDEPYTETEEPDEAVEEMVEESEPPAGEPETTGEADTITDFEEVVDEEPGVTEAEPEVEPVPAQPEEKEVPVKRKSVKRKRPARRRPARRRQ